MSPARPGRSFIHGDGPIERLGVRHALDSTAGQFLEYTRRGLTIVHNQDFIIRVSRMGADTSQASHQVRRCLSLNHPLTIGCWDDDANLGVPDEGKADALDGRCRAWLNSPWSTDPLEIARQGPLIGLGQVVFLRPL